MKKAGVVVAHMGVISQLGRDTLDRVRTLSAAGQTDAAIRAAQDLVSLGRTVSSSGRFLVYDRVGMELQREGLVEQQRIYEGLGNTTAVDDVGSRLQAIKDRAATIDVMVQSFGSVLAGMTEYDLAAYVDATILNGEFDTLQNLSEVAEALRKAQESRSRQKPETAP